MEFAIAYFGCFILIAGYILTQVILEYKDRKKFYKDMGWDKKNK